MKARNKDPFGQIGDGNRKIQGASALERRRDQCRLRRSFNEWSPVCEHILKSLGTAYNGKPSLLQKTLVFLFGRHNLFWYLMQGKIGHRVSVDRSALAWHLYVMDVQGKNPFPNWRLSYEHFCDSIYNTALVTISFTVGANAEPTGFQVTIEESNTTYTTELTEHALVDLLRKRALKLP